MSDHTTHASVATAPFRWFALAAAGLLFALAEAQAGVESKDVGGAGGVARRERHLAHSVDDRAGVEAGDVDVFDDVLQQLRQSFECVELSLDRN